MEWSNLKGEGQGIWHNLRSDYSVLQRLYPPYIRPLCVMNNAPEVPRDGAMRTSNTFPEQSVSMSKSNKEKRT